MCSSSSFYGLPREGSGVVEDEERFQGDLADMVRSISGAARLYPDSSSNWTQPSDISDDNIINDHHHHHQHHHHHHQVSLTAAPPDLSIFHDQQQPSYVDRISSYLNADYLGSDPFSSILMGDPLLLRHRDGDLMMMMMKSKGLLVDSTGAQGKNNSTFVDRRLQEATKKCQPAAATNISTNLVTPAPPVSPRKEILFLKPAPASFTLVGGSEDVDHGSSNGMLNDNRTGSLGISPPRNPAIKRRKSLAKKVVCIPAPAPANSKPSGEVVPSDLWAWRKYGQKPIKGSPYPRGYYRCSSTKGCSARKQVERSRTNPNMLVITYTSEHNHPWPTQRNALAGSTRSHSQSQPSKNSKQAPASSNTTSWVLQDNNKFNAEKRSGEEATEMMRHSKVMASEYLSVSSNAFIKEELGHEDCSNQQQDRDYDDDDDCDKIYRPTTVALPFNQEQVEQSQEDFFSELGEITGKDAFSYLDTAVI